MTTPYEDYLQQLELDFDRPDCLSNKVKLCSYLVCCGATVELGGYERDDKDLRTGNSGLQLLVGHPQLRALIPTAYMNGENPVMIRGNADGQAVLEYAGVEFFPVEVLTEQNTGNSSISAEFDTLIAAIPNEPYGVRSCLFHKVQTPCAFCVLTEKIIPLGPPDLVAAYDRVTAGSGSAPQVLLTGGTEPGADRGLAKYLPYVVELRREFPNARVAIEASPPENPSSLDPLIEAGMDTFAANIEFYSGQTRRDLLPAKSRIPLDAYRNALRYCNRAGVRTFSAVIAGPEGEADTIRAVEFLADAGTPTNFLCLRPFPGAALADSPRVNPSWYLRMTCEANAVMARHGVLDDLAATAGCGSCGACSMEMNLYRLAQHRDTAGMAEKCPWVHAAS